MTTAFPVAEAASRITEKFPRAVIESGTAALLINSGALLSVLAFLKDTEDLGFDYLNYITAVDYYSYFEVVYQLTSLAHNHNIILKTRCYDREHPSLPSAVGLWQAADFQEREIYDLLGIRFEGHPNLKRIFLWEGFQGYPLRKDYLG
jgi:NADH-quinone oxidoreductase subunit C